MKLLCPDDHRLQFPGILLSLYIYGNLTSALSILFSSLAPEVCYLFSKILGIYMPDIPIPYSRPIPLPEEPYDPAATQNH